MILCLDAATTLGWAAGKPGETPEWGSIRFRGDLGWVGLCLRNWLVARWQQFRPDKIVYESPFIGQNAAVAAKLYGLRMIIEATACELGTPCYEETARTVAKFFIGTGGLKRDEKKARTIAMCKRYGWGVGQDDNAADALALWAYCEHLIAGPVREMVLT